MAHHAGVVLRDGADGTDTRSSDEGVMRVAYMNVGRGWDVTHEFLESFP